MKVFARKTNGNVIFYKDGYTDLRGHFEYITRIDVQSLGQFNKFAFLVVSDNLGSEIKDADVQTKITKNTKNNNFVMEEWNKIAQINEQE